jgi:hypothetical protein
MRDQLKKNEMGGARGMHGRDGEILQNLSENLKGTEHLEDLDVDGRIILSRIFKKYGVRL